ncbi:hypothetical protein PHLGIDRAFT_80369 [Phlebiopsis gigantea 11061_1 CR5-6]|uniref:Haloacid dehalogenase n=1 Tax=Phlebiopsis gigantea (strain 11061_1 CR5-6) TaxID=745531 RepID=A0A0C3RPS7_PHLG1|nr:hypothetical protein PHLGIDRAFT_80369 [Phlebiopsis gigantea 11061_1 CR5-6]
MSQQLDPETSAVLRGAQAFLFDVFGTVVDWEGSVSRLLRAHYTGDLELDWLAFAREWRRGYGENTKRIAAGGEGARNIDELHRQILDGMLAAPRWAALGAAWDTEQRAAVNLVWHQLDGWPDAAPGLRALKQHAIVGTLSNGNVRLLVDMAKHADLAWDVVFSGELLGSYKPNPVVYRTALAQLALAAAPGACVLVAAHIYDLRAAAAQGFRTVYVRRPTEDAPERESVCSRRDGGEVDLVVDSFEELAALVARAHAG